MAKFLVTRVRHQLEGITVEAASSTEAIGKARKTKRAEWNHLDSKRRRAYKADKVDIGHAGRTR